MFCVDAWQSDLVRDDSDDGLIGRLRAAQKKPIEKTPPPPHEKDDNPWDVVLADSGSFTLLLLSFPLRVIRWVREKSDGSPG